MRCAPQRHQADPARPREGFFFEADVMSVEEPPNGADRRLLLPFIEQPVLDLFQRQVGLLPHQIQQPLLVLLQRRPALTPIGFGFKTAGFPPALRPADCRRVPDYKLPCSCSRRRPGLNHLDHSNSQIVRIPHRNLLSWEKATESYSCLEGNPLDSQKVETALARLRASSTR